MRGGKKRKYKGEIKNMTKNKGMQLGALLAAMLIVSIAFITAVSAQGANEQTKVETLGKIMTPDGHHIMNESDFDNAVIKRGTVKLPNTNTVNERINATKNVMNQLRITLEVSDDEALDTLCNYSANECTYRISKLVKTPADNTPPATNGWTEDAQYYNSGGTTLFEGIWNVPSAPLNQAAPLQTIFYFIALENSAQNDILQPVLEWGQAGRNYWDISSWFVIPGNTSHSTPLNVSVGDSIYGYIQKQTGNHWFIYTLDITKNSATSTTASSADSQPWNYVTLESYRVNNCNQFSGGNDFTNLNIAGKTPSWTSWINQSQTQFCGTLGVNIRSSSEVILQTGRMP